MITTKLIFAPHPLSTRETDTAKMFHLAGSPVADLLDVVGRSDILSRLRSGQT